MAEVGILLRPAAASVTGVTGQTVVFDGAANAWRVWSGSAWIPESGVAGTPAAFTDVGIQAAVDTVNAAGGGTVLLPAGLYLKAGATWATVTMRDHVKLQGPLGPLGQRTGQAGKGAVLRNNDNVDTLTYSTTGDNSLSTTIQGLSFEGTGTGAHINIPDGANRIFILDNSFSGKVNGLICGTGAVVSSAYNLWIQRNTFYNQTGHQVLFQNSTGAGGVSYYFRDNYVGNPADSFSSLVFSGTTSWVALDISDNIFSGSPTGSAPIVDLSGGGLRGFTFSYNDLENFPGRIGLRVTNGNGGTIIGNAISNASGGTCVSIITSNSIWVQGNRFGTPFTTALLLDSGSSSIFIGPNSGCTPITDASGVGVYFTKPSDDTPNLGISQSGGLRMRAGVGFDLNNNTTFTDGIVGRGAGSGWSGYANGNEYLRLNNNGVFNLAGAYSATLTTPAYTTSIAINAAVGNTFHITATSTAAFTIANPTNATLGEPIGITLRNAAGASLGTVTWDTLYKLSAWTQPANGFSRSIAFNYNGTNWIESTRTTVDVPN